VQFVINYEEGGENCILYGDNASEAFLSEIVGAQPYAGLRHMNMESHYEYGSRAGSGGCIGCLRHDRCR
jgi:allantoinase